MPGQPIQRQTITALHRDGHEFRAEFALSVDSRGEAIRVIAVVRAIVPDAGAEEVFRQSERFRRSLRGLRLHLNFPMDQSSYSMPEFLAACFAS